jgi:hypothetical protein
MFRRILSIFGLLILLLNVSVAQHSVMLDRIRSTYYFSITKNDFEDHKHTNYLLQQIAFENSISFKKLKLSVNYSLNVKVKEVDKANSLIDFKLKIDGVGGDTYIEDFKLNGFAFPSICTFECLVKDKKTNRIYEQIYVRKLLKNNQFSISSNVQGLLKPDEFDIEIAGIAFYFSEEDVVRFKEYISTIKSYRITSFLAGKLIKDISVWRPDMERNHMFSYFKIREIERVISYFDKLNLKKILDLKLNDPLDFSGKFEKLKSLKRRMSTLLKDGVAEAKLYFPDSQQLAIDIVNMQNQYANCLTESPYDCTSYLNDLARIAYTNAFFTRAYSYFSAFYNEKEKQAYISFLKDLINELKLTYEKEANSLILNKRFLKAESYIYNASALVSNQSNTEEIKSLHSRSVYGLYYSYLNIANRALGISKIDMVILYLNKAIEYQKAHDAIISDISAVSNAYQKLGTILLNEAVVLKNKQLIIESGFYLNELANIYKYNRDQNLLFQLKYELSDLYKLGNVRIHELDNSRYYASSTEELEQLNHEALLLKGSQQNILNNIDRLNAY